MIKRYKLQVTRYTNAFTLVEILVVLAITALLSGIIITYTGTGRAQVALYVEEAKLSQVILRAKSLTISTYNNSNPALIPCGYGVHIDYSAGTYSLFAYPRPTPAPAPCPASITSINPSDPDQYQQVGDAFPLAKELKFETTPFLDYIDTIFFRPPDPKTFLWINGVDAPPILTGFGTVYLSTNNNSLQSTIEVTLAGQVNVMHY